LHIRPATRADSADIVILDDIASSGLASHVLQVGVREGKYDRPLEFGRDGYAFIDGAYSWKNVLIAETEDGIAGMSLSFELTGGPGDQGLPDPVLGPLEALKALAVGTRMIDSVAVYTRFRGQGIGRALVQAELGRAGGASSIITDVIIIGSGPGGYIAAIRAAQLGLKTAVVEREHLAGICSNWGCIPTKALLRSAEVLHLSEHAKNYGLKLEGTVTPDLQAIVKRSRGMCRPAQRRCRAPAEEEQGAGDLGRGEDIEARRGYRVEAVEEGDGAAAPRSQGHAGEGTYKAKNIIVATGARPRVLPGLEPDGKLVWTYFEAMVPPEMPKSLLVVGSGAIGIEFASFYNAMGVDVTVVEIVDQIMPVEDTEIAGIARKQLEKQGMKIMTGAKVAGLNKGANDVTAPSRQRTARRPN
jgi:thioredoxin reductase/predicted GNAT family acetyltransferase